MKHIKRINESVEDVLTWNKITHDPSIDFIHGNKKINDISSKIECLRLNTTQLDDPIDLSSPKKDIRHGSLWFKTTNNNIRLYANYNLSLVLVFKNKDLLSVLSMYEIHGCSFFKDTIVVFGHENIILYDTQDFSFKNIYTR